MAESPQSPEPARKGRLVLMGVVAVLSVALDLLSKEWVWQNLRKQDPRVFVDGFFQLRYAFNPGSAFGFLGDAEWSRYFFIAVTVAAVIYMVRLAMTLPARFVSGYIAIGLIIGGALGNLHDRFVREDFVTVISEGTRVTEIRHGVVDFIVVHYWPGKEWPAFNIADAALVAGVLLFLIYLRRHGHVEASPPARA
ncbi:MAG: signal peptidase II [Nannocystaceae bacterium]